MKVQKATFDVELIEDGQKYALFTTVAGSSLFGRIAALKEAHKTVTGLTVKITVLSSGKERIYYISV